jgi:hypothetical protein
MKEEETWELQAITIVQTKKAIANRVAKISPSLPYIVMVEASRREPSLEGAAQEAGGISPPHGKLTVSP